MMMMMTLLGRHLETTPPGDINRANSQVVPPSEILIGRLLKSAVQRNPDDAKPGSYWQTGATRGENGRSPTGRAGVLGILEGKLVTL